MDGLASAEWIRRERIPLIVSTKGASTVRAFDMLCFMEQGRILEKGTYDELMQKRMQFYDLVRKQNHDLLTQFDSALDITSRFFKSMDPMEALTALQ